VLSGAAMTVATSREHLRNYLTARDGVSPDHPVVITKFETNAKEIEIDAVADRGELVLWAISEHVENAGVHSGDATLVLPPQKLYVETMPAHQAHRGATSPARWRSPGPSTCSSSRWRTR
jgi:carbamoyl-phosphate synthase large subunit